MDYRTVEASAATPVLTLRWSNLGSLGCLPGAIGFLLTLVSASLTVAIAVRAKPRAWDVGDAIFVSLGFLLFLALTILFGGAVLGTSFAVIDRDRGQLIRGSGILFIPLTRREHRLRSEPRVYVTQQTSRGSTSFVVNLDDVELSDHNEPNDADRQAERIRAYLAPRA